MASSILHIKDSYYFEVPRALWSCNYRKHSEFPDFWVRLDPEYQNFEARRIYSEIKGRFDELPEIGTLLHDYEHWKHEDHANAGKPFDVFLTSRHGPEAIRDRVNDANFPSAWKTYVAAAKKGSVEAYKKDTSVKWDSHKVDRYNYHLSGKVLIPQPFGELRNLYEESSGFCVSRFMIIEIGVALVLCCLFSWLAQRVSGGGAPRGKLWNLLEAFVKFIRDQVARPAIDSHDHGHDEHGHGDHGHEKHGRGHDHAGHSHGSHAHLAVPEHEGDRFVPILLTIFFFVLGCNLSGMLPWVGSPTGSWSVTFALACVTFLTVVVAGVARFGPVGFILNQIPGMDLPLPIAIIVKPMLLVIELVGLLIKHGVLSVRLLANMVAGHVVLLAVMTLAFSVEGAASSWWPVTATISLLGSTLLSCLELFVAFLQAYVFAFLSALFIGAAVHKH